jgi:hypothetical protein
MTTRDFTANVISATKVVPDGKIVNSSASGVWSLEEAFDLTKGDNWPNAANLAPRALFGAIDQDNNGTYTGIEKIEIETTGNSTDYGDLSVSRNNLGSCSSVTRAIFCGGSSSNVIDYVEFASAGNASDFGDLGNTAAGCVATSNSTRGIITRLDDIFYITIATTGNSSTFGTHDGDRAYCGSCASDTRAVFAGGISREQTMDYVTIASTGNAADFGNCSGLYERLANGSVASETRGIFAGGYSSNSGGVTDTISYITIASTGNTTDFGNLATTKSGQGSASSLVRGTFAGGVSASAKLNVIEYITIGTTGNTTDFGDLTIAEANPTAGCSNAHGGLQ